MEGSLLFAESDRVDARVSSKRSIAVRLFLTCWLVYVLHFATNIVREIFPALALGDHFSFRVDEYANMHPDLYEKEGFGWHIGNNPGASMLAAIPYALARPVIDPIVKYVQQKRSAGSQNEPPEYNSPWPMAREFYSESWRRGYDIKFGLAAFVMQSMCMAPSSALAAVVMFYVLFHLFRSEKMALWLALLYAFGTPVFFRTGYLNQNLMLGHFAFMGFVAMWNPAQSERWTTRTRFFLGGLAGGAALLFDYSGLIFLLGLLTYGIFNRLRAASGADAFRHACWYAFGSLAPVALLWFYQWKSFGHPIYPGQHWMPIIEWVRPGYRGITLPKLELLFRLAFDYRYGLFLSSPILLLALWSPWMHRDRSRLPGLELAAFLGISAALYVFFSTFHGVLVQYNTGIRYLAPVFPFLFIPASLVLMRLPVRILYFVALVCVMESWCLAMHRDVEQGLGLLDPILSVFWGGFKLPALTTLSRLEQFRQYFDHGISPLPLFALVAAILYGIWAFRFQGKDKISE